MKIKLGKILCFDIDNVICKTKRNDYKNSKPIHRNIKLINNFYLQGFFIKIFTARFMGRNNENIFKAKKAGFDFTKDQLKKWGLKYDKLIFGKPSYDIFIDDRCLFYKKNWHDTLIKFLKK
jgi:capsule biosynthesis phosphatase